MRRLIARLVIAPFLLFGSALAPLHVHESGRGHSHALIHSHLEAHHLDAHQDEGPEFEPNAGRVVWLSSAILDTATHHIDPAHALIFNRFVTVVADTSWSTTAFESVAPAHGPPRRHPSFRGPPLSPA